VKKSKSAGIPKAIEDVAARREQESRKRLKRTYWTIRKSDERIIQTRDIIDRTRRKLRAAGKSPVEPPAKPDANPDLDWDKLIISEHENRKRRTDD